MINVQTVSCVVSVTYRNIIHPACHNESIKMQNFVQSISEVFDLECGKKWSRNIDLEENGEDKLDRLLERVGERNRLYDKGK